MTCLFEHHRIHKDNGDDEQNNTLHVMDDASRIATHRVGPDIFDTSKPETEYHLGDHLDSSSVVLNSTGSFINREEYRPYGETSFGSYDRKRYRYSGKERDGESSLYYHGARYYAPWLARWTSPDPAGMVDGVNLYEYVRGNPVKLRDPDGMEAGEPRERTVEVDGEDVRMTTAGESGIFYKLPVGEEIREDMRTGEDESAADNVGVRQASPEEMERLEEMGYDAWYDADANMILLDPDLYEELFDEELPSAEAVGLFFHEMEHARDWHQKLESHKGYQEGEMTRAEAVEDITPSTEDSIDEYVDFHSALEERAFGTQRVAEVEYRKFREIHERLSDPDGARAFWEIERRLTLPDRPDRIDAFQTGVDDYWKGDAVRRYQPRFQARFRGSEVSDTARDILRDIGAE